MKDIEFHYDRNTLTAQYELLVSLADLRDLVQAFTIPDEAQRLQEIQVVLASVVRKNKLPTDSLSVK
ncbi:hypothetical protein AVMA1855_19915 [Acidovorax sp. SUPP1855]|uniref:hypothetical protein n=1 Tax=Acidovorax sp. SUPP1855 TaxID=431774 RepID=UPI0023DE46DE|nr:hypothetical protein [Acidovorax sp. SUPP1855]GKS86457.1 hypothetical protein AVMA1855_19915 [Acidovorax sp. SUPP1855]